MRRDSRNFRRSMDKITMAHGSGGESTARLIDELFAKELGNPYLAQMEDSTVVPGSGRLAVTTDSFVVTPAVYPGGDIGRLCVCGTVNDLLMSGAVPKYLTLGAILEEGLPLDTLQAIVHSIAETAAEAGVAVVAGDTKVVENHSGENGGILLNTAVVGFLKDDAPLLTPDRIREDDAVLVSGNLGAHHAAILGRRMDITNRILSDNAPLTDMVRSLTAEVDVHEMRDVTRGGLATVLHEFAKAAGMQITLEEEALPVSNDVKSFAGILGLDPLYMGNEGKMTAIVAAKDADRALSILRNSRYGENAAIIGRVEHSETGSGTLILNTAIGGQRVLGPLYGEGLPRIC